MKHYKVKKASSRSSKRIARNLVRGASTMVFLGPRPRTHRSVARLVSKYGQGKTGTIQGAWNSVGDHLRKAIQDHNKSIGQR